MAVRPALGTERIRFHDGVRLTSRDLEDDTAYEARMRVLHTRALHDTWGVALGLELWLSDDRRQVLVTPGLAYDCYGREILLGVALRLHAPSPRPGVPAADSIFDLVLRYDDRAGAAERHRPTGTCLGGGRWIAEERGALRWAYAGAGDDSTGGRPVSVEVRLGEDVPLGRFRIDDGGALVGPSLAPVRRTDRALRRPRVGSGVVRPGALEWTSVSARAPSVLVATVDTTAAGFSTTPHYVATLPQPARFDEEEDLVVGPFVALDRAEPRSFRLRLLFAYRPPGVDRPSILQRLATGATVSWMGVEPFTGCVLAVRPDQVYDLSGCPVSAPEKVFGRLGAAVPRPAVEGADL